MSIWRNAEIKYLSIKEIAGEEKKESEKMEEERRAKKKEEDRCRREMILEKHKIKKAIEEAEKEVRYVVNWLKRRLGM